MCVWLSIHMYIKMIVFDIYDIYKYIINKKVSILESIVDYLIK